MISYNYYYTLVGEAKKSSTEEAFLGEIGYPQEIDLAVDDFVQAVRIIYAVANDDFKQLITLTQKSLSAFARKYGFSLRTAQAWMYGENPVNKNVMLLLGYAMLGDIYAAQNKEDVCRR